MAKMLSLSDFLVKVKRNNTETEEVYLGENHDVGFHNKSQHLFPGPELERFIDSEFPQWSESWITTGFEFDIKRLGDIEGIIKPQSLVS